MTPPIKTAAVPINRIGMSQAPRSRTPERHGRNGVRENAPASWSAAALCRFVPPPAVVSWRVRFAGSLPFIFAAILAPSLQAQHKVALSPITNEFIAPPSNQGEF